MSENGNGDDSSGKGRAETAPRWLSLNPSKRRGELFFAAWCVVWIAIFGYIVLSRIFETFTPNDYMTVGVIVGLPPIIVPLLFPGLVGDAHLPWYARYTTKANIWVFTYAWIGNYFWTHYFYRVLGCKYTFEAHRLNDVPFALYLISHSYFLLYHTLSNVLLRRLWSVFRHRATVVSVACVGAFIVAFSVWIAFMEVFTIQNFPYYNYPDKRAMWTVGSVFYAIYFSVSFPMYYRLDEDVRGDTAAALAADGNGNGNGNGKSWSLSRTFFDVCAAGMICTQLLDAWRLAFGPIFDVAAASAGAPVQVPFIN